MITGSSAYSIPILLSPLPFATALADIASLGGRRSNPIPCRYLSTLATPERSGCFGGSALTFRRKRSRCSRECRRTAPVEPDAGLSTNNHHHLPDPAQHRACAEPPRRSEYRRR